MLNRFKGQGALEYLLLIGGAVVVAAVVIVLLLGTSSTGGSQAQTGSAASMCTNAAILAGTKSCADLEGGTDDYAYLWDTTSKSCWLCTGSYPNCATTKNPGGRDEAVECCNNGAGCIAGGTSANGYYKVG